MISKDIIKKEAREWIEAIAIALVATLIIRTFVIQAFKIPSESMVPTLKVGDKLFVNKFVYRFRDPERWEVIVFKYPEDRKKDFIKRVVATEGEELKIVDGMLFVDGRPQNPPQEIVDNYYYNGGEYGSEDQTIVVPEDCYYVLGDNSLHSRDSRFWGFVSQKDLVGKAVYRWWPFNRMGRLDRIFDK